MFMLRSLVCSGMEFLEGGVQVVVVDLLGIVEGSGGERVVGDPVDLARHAVGGVEKISMVGGVNSGSSVPASRRRCSR